MLFRNIVPRHALWRSPGDRKASVVRIKNAPAIDLRRFATASGSILRADTSRMARARDGKPTKVCEGLRDSTGRLHGRSVQRISHAWTSISTFPSRMTNDVTRFLHIPIHPSDFSRCHCVSSCVARACPSAGRASGRRLHGGRKEAGHAGPGFHWACRSGQQSQRHRARVSGA